MSAFPADSLRLTFPAELPITAHVDEIRAAIRDSQVVIVAGETGSGKTTQLPKICLAAGLGVDGMIGHTQPRRLAARAVASRIAEELAVPLGAEVGYAVRFNDVVSPSTRVKLITDGLLLTEIRRDRRLNAYDCLIVDEAHERSLNIDFLLGYLKAVLAARPAFKVVITSATIDVAAFASYFGGAPVIEVGGRGYPVALRYLDDEAVTEPFEDQLRTVLEDIETGPQSAARDILLFLPGEREIMETSRHLRGAFGERLEILPLYARLSAADQQRVFKPGKQRRIVLATNVAETSLTVPNIGYVIDPGLARISRYSYRSKLQRLPVEPISQASARQRAGRCGRVAPGICFRLYTEADFDSRPPYTDPEIKRTNLAAVVLQMRAFRLGDPFRFPFIEPPDPRLIRDAEKLLVELGAIADGKLTQTGATMARLPVDPRLARMLVEADRTRALTEALVIASALAVSDPRERPLEKQGSADRAHEQWLDERSDFLGYLNLWQWAEDQRERLNRAAARRSFSKHFLSANRMHEWRALHRQLLLAVKAAGMRLNTEPADYAGIHKALLAGSLGLIGGHDERGEFVGPRNLRFRIFPGSALAGRRPKWLLAAEIIETRRVYAHTVAGVEARWIEEAAQHLVKRRFDDPHWSLARGEAQVYETVTLYGLVLSERRPVSLKRIDRDGARSLLLLDGLVRGAVKRPPEFLEHNLKLMTAIREDEDKGRRRDLLLPEAEIAARYDGLLPDHVATLRDLNRWLRKAPDEELGRLFLAREDLESGADAHYLEEDFPSTLTMKGAEFQVRYRFAPGADDDGVSVEVPLGMIDAVVPQTLEWSVPGMLAGVCEQWLRALPKSLRRRLTPIPDTVAAILPTLRQPSIYRQGRLDVTLARILEADYGVAIRADDWHPERIEPQWRVNVQVRDERGRVRAQGRDAQALKASFAREVAARIDAGLGSDQQTADLKDFPAQGLADTVVLGERGREVVAYPVLEDQGDSVAVRHLTDARSAAAANKRGYARLALLKLGQLSRQLKKEIAADKALGLLFAPLGSAEQFRDELLRASAWACFFEGIERPDDATGFAERLAARRGELYETFRRLASDLRSILEERLALVRALDAASSPAYSEAVADIRAQLEWLVPADLLSTTPSRWLPEISRYLAAARYRVENLQGKVARDREQTQVLGAFTERIERLGEVLGRESEDWLEVRFLLEEVRVNLFAERIGAQKKASPTRLHRRLEALERDHGLI